MAPSVITAELPAEYTRAEGWPEQGSWTWEDYLRLPDDGRRHEILEGVLYVSPAPDFDHQYCVCELARQLGDFARNAHLGLVLVAPFDVRLPHVASPVQPDVLFFRTGNQPRSGDAYFEGAPDLVVEVFSPGSRRIDQGVKLEAYEKAGIPEYWLVDPRSRTVVVQVLEGRTGQSGTYRQLGHFEGSARIRSRLFTDLTLEVSSLFAPTPS